MPAFPYLFETAQGGPPPPNSIAVPPGKAKAGVTYIVPTARGRQLIAYLISLNKTFPLPEAKQ